MMIIWEGGVEAVLPVLVVPVTGGGPGQAPVQAVTERDPHVEEQQTSGNPLKVMSPPACFTQIEFTLIHKVIKMLIWCNTSFKHKNRTDVIQKWINRPSITRQQAWQLVTIPVRLLSGLGLHSWQEVGPVFSERRPRHQLYSSAFWTEYLVVAWLHRGLGQGWANCSTKSQCGCRF